jgi:hypothetical protein
MADSEVSQTIASDLTKPVHDLLDGIITEFKRTAADKDAAEPRLFFPNGIELIQVIVKVGPADVEVKIAGQKGVRETQSRATGKVRIFDDHDMEVCALVNTEDIFRGDHIIWHNDGKDDVEIVFDVDGCPLNISDFIVPKNGGVYLTIVLTTVDAGTYDYHCYIPPRRAGSVPVLGNPKIIIQ